MRTLNAALLSLGLAIALAYAHDYNFDQIMIGHPYARATPPGALAGGAFLTIDNRGRTADRLVRVASPAAGVSELHEMAMDGGVMRMRAVKGIDVLPGQKVELKPGGYHVMLMDLKAPLKPGDKFPLTLTFERAGSVEVAVEVMPMGAPAATH